MASTIVLQSNDGENFTVDVKAAMKSTTIKNMIDELGLEEGDDEPVPLPNVNSMIFKKIIEWATYHKDDPAPPEEEEEEDHLRNTTGVDQSTLFDILLASNYLDIKGLTAITSKTIANMIKGKTPEEIRETFYIENDYTAEEEEKIRKENEWVEEK